MKGLVVGLVVLGALGGGFVAGRLSAPGALPAEAGARLTLRPLPVQAQAQGDPREIIPLVPGPGDEPGRGQPGQQPGPQQPGQQQGQGQEQCVLLFKDGQMYRLQPGQPQPGQGQPGQPQPGGDGRGNQPGGDNELFPLEPYSPAPGQGPSQPGGPALPDLNRRL